MEEKYCFTEEELKKNIKGSVLMSLMTITSAVIGCKLSSDDANKRLTELEEVIFILFRAGKVEV